MRRQLRLPRQTRLPKYVWLSCCTLVMFAFASAQAGPTKMSVQVRKSEVRGRPSFLGKVLATVSYTDEVEVLKEQGTWMQVRTKAGVEGWMHKSALSKDKIVAKAGASNVETSADQRELAMAGKGFNQEVEDKFKERNKDIDFTWIDKMEKIKVSSEQMQAFLDKGKVVPTEGGAQ